MNDKVQTEGGASTVIRDSRMMGAPSRGGISWGGGDDGNQMETRIAKLESDVTHINKTLEDIKEDIREIRSHHHKLLYAGVGACFVVLVALAGGYMRLSSHSERISNQLSRAQSSIQEKITADQASLQKEIYKMQLTMQHIADSIDKPKH